MKKKFDPEKFRAEFYWRFRGPTPGTGDAKYFADTVMKIINKCIAVGATKHRLFRKFLENSEAEIADL